KKVGPKQIIMTANSEVIYAFSVLDLSKTGLVVAEVPAGLPGGFWDFWERGVEDIGLGRSEKGGKFLLLPTDSKVEMPLISSQFAAKPATSSSPHAAS